MSKFQASERGRRIAIMLMVFLIAVVFTSALLIVLLL